MIQVLLTFFLVGFVSLVCSCGTGVEQVNSKSPSSIQSGNKEQGISAAAQNYSDTLVTNDGEVYKSAKIKEVTPAGIKVTHASGISEIPYEKLPKELQDELGGFNSKKAEEHRKKIADQQARIADAFEARKIQNDKLERDRRAKLANFRQAELEDKRRANAFIDSLVKTTRRRPAAESTDSLIARLAAQQRVKTIEQERMREEMRRAIGNSLDLDTLEINRRLKQLELENRLREQEERGRQLHDALKNQ